jgi:hypothetical protein
MIKLYIFLFISFQLGSISYAQQSSLTIGLGKPLQTTSRTDISGSPYMFDEFQKGQLITQGGRSLSNVAIRYDIVSQSVEYLTDNQVYDITDSVAQFQYIDSTSEKNKFLKLKPAGAKASFYKVIVPGKYALLKKFEISITSDEDWFTKKISKKYVKKEDFYLLEGGKVSKLGTSKKAITALFKDNADLKAVVNSDNVDARSENSLVSFFQKINSLSN